MSNYYKSIGDILRNYKENNHLSVILKEAENYFAHTPKGDFRKKKETLIEHLDLVGEYFYRLVQAHNLENIIDKLIRDYLSKINLSNSHLFCFIKELFVYSIYYHDYGKVNENFQSIKMSNPNFQGKENSDNGIDTQHSTLSAFIFLAHSIDKSLGLFLAPKEQNAAINLSFLFSYGIYKHHSYCFEDEFLEKIVSEGKRAEKLARYLPLFKKELKNKTFIAIFSNLESVLPRIDFEEYAHSFSLYQLIRLNFSLLTAADYLATNQYMSDDVTDSFGILTNTRFEEIYAKVSQDEWIDDEKAKRNFNRQTYEELDTLSLVKPNEKSFENLNLLRRQMAVEAIRNIRANTDEKLFYIEAPTGGGKTNISVLVALELLRSDSELNKIYYVFPFTTLVDQSYASIKQMLGLNDKEIMALHSKAPFQNSEEEDDVYGNKKKNYINRLFVNYPFCMLSHIRFFDILKTNKKEANYLLHRLANSVVVIDELQSYNPQHWDKVIFLLQQYAHYYNIRFIIMSATLPKISELKIEGINTSEVINLIPNAKSDYFKNPNFSDRVTFDFSLLNKNIELQELAQIVLEKSIDYFSVNENRTNSKKGVYTIIEFIFKKTATRFYQEINSIHSGFFDKIFVLSGTILAHRRKHIINYLKCEENRNKKILLVTTQVVEAGVDIDMDLGFKDTSLLDSDEQLAGRINRNIKKNNCKLFLFDYNHEGVVYCNDLRYTKTRNLPEEIKREILETKNFDKLYQEIFTFKNLRNKDAAFVNIYDYTSHFNQLRFRSASEKFQLIEQETISCYIPAKIPIEIEGEEFGETETLFTKSELSFLAFYNIFPDDANRIDGEELFNLYLNIIQSEQSFTDKKIDIKQMQSLLSKFTISLFASNDIKNQLIHFSDEEKSEYGYQYLSRWNEFYSIEFGIDESKFYNIETQFF